MHYFTPILLRENSIFFKSVLMCRGSSVLLLSADKLSVCLKTVAGTQWTMKLEYPKRSCYGELVSCIRMWLFIMTLWSFLDEGCGFLTADCNTTSYPYSCTPCCDSSVQCAYDYQSAVSI